MSDGFGDSEMGNSTNTGGNLDGVIDEDRTNTL